MKRTCLVAVIAALFTAANVTVAQDQAPTQKKFGGTVVETDHIKAKVKKIDRKTREVTLENTEGETAVFVAGPDVQNFDQIKKGDKVDITSTDAMTLIVTSGAGASPSQETITEVERVPKGAKPKGTVTQTTSGYAVVTDIDYKDRTVTLKGPDRVATVKVGPEAVNFDQVKVGDNVFYETTKKVAIAVTK